MVDLTTNLGSKRSYRRDFHLSYSVSVAVIKKNMLLANYYACPDVEKNNGNDLFNVLDKKEILTKILVDYKWFAGKGVCLVLSYF